jgi:hypothetical protein
MTIRRRSAKALSLARRIVSSMMDRRSDKPM